MSNVQALTPSSTTSYVVLSSSVNIATVGDVITPSLPFNIYGTGGPLYSPYFLPLIWKYSKTIEPLLRYSLYNPA